MLSVLQADDQLMHLQWKDRGTGTVEVKSIPLTYIIIQHTENPHNTLKIKKTQIVSYKR